MLMNRKRKKMFMNRKRNKICLWIGKEKKYMFMNRKSVNTLYKLNASIDHEI